MWGRYSITTPVEALSRLFRFSGPLPNLSPRYNVAPTRLVPIVRAVPAVVSPAPLASASALFDVNQAAYIRMTPAGTPGR